jgi:dimethylargininase
MGLARAQHTAYVEVLRGLVPNVKVLPADEKFPDCVFVEDPAIVIGGHALLTQPGDPTRREETVRMRRVLRDEVGLVVMEVADPEAKLDGGDVLWTGREILVGLSSRTNEGGLKAVREAFSGFPVTGIQVAGPLHLKTLLTLCGEDTLCAAMETGNSYKMLEVSLKNKHFTQSSKLIMSTEASRIL